MPEIPGKFALTSDVAIETRTARGVNVRLAEAVRRTCGAIPHLSACYLLDARKPGTGEMALIIAATLDDEASQMDSVAQQFQAMLRDFPTRASNTFIMSSAQFAQEYAGEEFYIRRAA